MSRGRRISLGLQAAFYTAAGVMHLVRPEVYLPMMPDYLPWHRPLVLLSGVAELALGLALLVPALRRRAAWGLVALLVAVFPANLHIALNDVPLFGAETGAGWVNWLRLPLQLPLIAWAGWFTRPEGASVV